VASESPSAVAKLIHETTGGKPYVFVLMPFGSQWHLFEQVRSAVHDSTKLRCLRADDIPGAGFDLLEKIHIAIERAEVIIAEISERNANVFYELGFAAGIKKPILLIAQRGVEIPTDLRGRELILRSEDKDGTKAFGEELRSVLQRRMNTQITLLRDMLEAEKPHPAFIISSPRYPSEASRIAGQPRDRRTFGDNLGVLGLLQAFGSIFGETSGVELVSGQYCSAELPYRDHNLYVIGSPKVNLVVPEVMEMIQCGTEMSWRFGPAPGNEAKGNYPVSLYRNDGDSETEMIGKKGKREVGLVHVEDYGIIMRSPHPQHPGRILMVMAGAHSLGTGAACIAATRSQHIREIKDRGIDIANRSLAFWVLVRGVESKRDGLLDVDGVSIEKEDAQNSVESKRPSKS
jgi:hypothetical protein